jgi:hypothetical protein
MLEAHRRGLLVRFGTNQSSARHLTAKIGPELVVRGNGIMAYEVDRETVDLLDHLLSKRRRYAERLSSGQGVLPAIKMHIGDWYTDELGVLTREVRARD